MRNKEWIEVCLRAFKTDQVDIKFTIDMLRNNIRDNRIEMFLIGGILGSLITIIIMNLFKL